MHTIAMAKPMPAPHCSILTATAVSLLLVGCSGSSSNASRDATGGAQGLGGLGHTAGASATGGTRSASSSQPVTSSATGGSLAPASTLASGGTTVAMSGVTGGIHASGGDAMRGGASALASATGGATSAGGALGSGGAKNSGGTLATGGAATGGVSAATTSSKTSVGGSATGGANNTGGVVAAGQSSTGGSIAATGGSSPSGGASSSPSNPITIWMAGDSTMMNCSNAVCPCGWGSELGSYFNSKVTVTNRAVGGRSVQTWLYGSAVTDTMGSNNECVLSSNTYDTRWTSMLSSMKPGDYLMIAFGINDGDTKCPRHVGSALFQSLLDVMVKATKDKGGFPILLTPTDAIECSGTTVLQKRGFLTETKAVASANGVPLIDLNQLSMTLYSSLGFCPNDGDYTSTTSALGKFFCDDHTHFESAGAKQIAGVVVNALRTQGIALASYAL